MLVVLAVAEQRLRAVLEVLDGASVTEVARRFGVSRQTVHVWLRRYAAEGGLGNLSDRSSRPRSCPHQTPVVVEARVLTLRDGHPSWGPDRICWQLGQEGVVPVPGRSSVYRALVRNGRIDPRTRRRRRREFRRWERGRPMELWQIDVVGGIHLADGVEVKCVTGIDDNSRFVVSAMLVARATARPVCEALLAALDRHGVPEQILTDNGKVFTGRFGPNGAGSEVLFDRICVENGIKHLLTAPRSPTTTGKVERLHRTMRAEFFTDADGRFETLPALQDALDAWVRHYNTERPHQASGMAVPAERFALASRVPGSGAELVVVDPRPTPSRAGADHDDDPAVLSPTVGCSGGWTGVVWCIWPGSDTGSRSCWPGSRFNVSWPATWCRSTIGRCWSPPTSSTADSTGTASLTCRRGRADGMVVSPRPGRWSPGSPTTGSGVVRRNRVRGGAGVARQAAAGRDRGRVGPADQPGQGGAHPPDPS